MGGRYILVETVERQKKREEGNFGWRDIGVKKEILKAREREREGRQ